MNAPHHVPASDFMLEARRLCHSTRIRDALWMIVAAPRLVHALLAELDRYGAYTLDQLRRRDADIRELTGRRSVELEAAAREGYHYGRADQVNGVAPIEVDQIPHRVFLAARNAAEQAKPREVLGEMVVHGRGGMQ